MIYVVYRYMVQSDVRVYEQHVKTFNQAKQHIYHFKLETLGVNITTHKQLTNVIETTKVMPVGCLNAGL